MQALTEQEVRVAKSVMPHILRYLNSRLKSFRRRTFYSDLIQGGIYSFLCSIPKIDYRHTNSQILGYLMSCAYFGALKNFHRNDKFLQYQEMDNTILPLESRHGATTSMEKDVLTRVRVQESLDLLEEPHRSIMVLKFYDQLSNAEIADTLGLTIAQVRRIAGEAFAAMREKLIDD